MNDSEVKIRKKIGSILRESRNNLGITPDDFYKKSGIDIPRATLYKYEKNGPSRETLRFLQLISYYKLPILSMLSSENVNKTDKDLVYEYFHIPEFIELCIELNKIPLKRRVLSIKFFAKFITSVFGPTRRGTLHEKEKIL